MRDDARRRDARERAARQPYDIELTATTEIAPPPPTRSATRRGLEIMTETTKASPTLNDLAAEVQRCVGALKACEAETIRARKSETDACNALNRAQAAFDAAVDALRKGAPSDSGWGANRRLGCRHV